jgi:alanyl-tRNA synthetase
VRDTCYGLPGLTVHEARAVARFAEGDEVEAADVDVRRDRIRRNHTATHVLHWAMREVLGTHVQQAGSLVAPDRLRFDFSHHEPVTPEQLAQVERLANGQVISDAPVRHDETTKAEAERVGAIAFFGEKYGEIVRVLEAGPSVELCGGTSTPWGSSVHRPSAKVPSAPTCAHRSDDRRRRSNTSSSRSSSCAAASSSGRRPRRCPTRSSGSPIRSAAGRARPAEARETADGGRARGAGRRRPRAPRRQRTQGARPARTRLYGRWARPVVGAADRPAAIAIAVGKGAQAAGANAGEIAAPRPALGGGTAKNAELVSGGGKHVDQVDAALEVLREQVMQ